MKRLLAVLAVASTLLPASAFAQVTPAATTNLSSTIVTGNTFQGITGLALLGSPPAGRRSVTIQNNNTNADNCWLFIGATANASKATAILLTPGGSYQRYSPYIPSDNFSITCTSTNDTFYADTQ